ncbi:alpha/beta hydrolase [Subsaxibacter sp. CAU 1640]|uniref:alpha/beta hydrolase n=1 Tax=Subsaxibacter sp. CAU 1640 TaxID=2933271 RepID=UPI00200662AE|nr:alpha/beta hydrolase [Subsaxibacter sp. CAU 1640]MCK7592017.1 alpha/beta hydrolase [Subsaxibacter sp. CAU 1640]
MKELIVKFIGGYYNCISYLSKSRAADKALYLFTKPRNGRKLTDEQREFLGTAFQKEYKFGEYDIMTYRWLGSKPTILLVHGWESNSYRWRNLVCELKKRGHNVVALDAPAHGKSGSQFFNAILYSEFINVVATRFQPEIIIGHSVGGMSTAFFQNKYQLESVKKLILLGAPSEFTDVLKRYTDMLGYNQRITNQLNLTIVERFGDKPENFSTAKYLGNINSKGLIIHDELDTIIPYSDALLLKNSFKNSTLITTKGLGHSLNHESVSDHIYAFIEN